MSEAPAKARAAWGRIAVAEMQRRERMAEARKLREQGAHPQRIRGLIGSAKAWNGLVRTIQRELRYGW